MSMVTPRIDLVFKKIFGVEENKDLLISLINSVVSKDDHIDDVQILNPYNAQNFKHDKLSVLDIKAQGKDGKRFNIEIQITDEGNYDKRALYYWAKLYSEQLSTGEQYGTLCKAIGIHILNFSSILENARYHNVFHVKEQETGERYFTDFELHTVELKKFIGATSQELSDLVSKIKTALDRWVAFLTRHELLDRKTLPRELDDEALKKALEILEVMNFSKEERESYEDRLKWLRHEASAIDLAEARGIEIGEVRGIEKMALNMLKQGLSPQIIFLVTGLSLEKIKALENKVSVESH